MPDTQPHVPEPGPGEAIPVEDAFPPAAVKAEESTDGPPPDRQETKAEAQRERTVGKR